MAYTKQTWANGIAGGTPISAARLAHIEDGIENASQSVAVVGWDTTGVTSSNTQLSAAIATVTALPSGGEVVIGPGVLRLSSNLTVPANVMLNFTAGARIKLDTGVILTIDSTGGLKAGLHYIFDITAAGSAVFAPQISDWHVQWFGAKGDDSTDDSVAVQKTLTTAQTSLRNPNVIFGAGIFRIGTALAYGSASRGITIIGVSLAARQQGSANAVCVVKWTGGAFPLFTANGFITITGIAFQNWGTGTSVLKVDDDGERPHVSYCSFVQPSGSGPAWSLAALDLTNFNYSHIEYCEVSVAPFLRLTETGTRCTISNTVIDCVAGSGPAILADCNADIIQIGPSVTFNVGEAAAGLWNNTASTQEVSVLNITGVEFNGINVPYGPVVQAKNVRMLRLLGSQIAAFGNQTDNLFLLTNSRAFVDGNTGSSVHRALFRCTDALSSVWAGVNNLNPANTGGILDSASQSGTYIPVTIGSEFAGSARIHGELGSCLADTVYAVTVTTASAFSVICATLLDSSHQGFLTLGQRFTVLIKNTSGGAMGAITWSPVFKMAAWTNPANGFSRTISFVWNGTNAIQIAYPNVDIPN